MRDTDVAPDEQLERLRAACRTAGIKVTHQRIEIFREVAANPDHPDTEAVFLGVRRRLPTISLDTVYRTLALLEDLGLVTVMGSWRGARRFDPNLSAHHHFVCERCGVVRDFEHAEFDALTPPAAVGAMGTVRSTSVEVRGVCAVCAGRRQRAGSAKKGRRR